MSEDTQRSQGTISPVLKTFVISLVVAIALGAAVLLAAKLAWESSGLDAQEAQGAYVASVASSLEASPTGDGYRSLARVLQELDSSPERFWALSENGTLLFVKDEAESNEYRGLPVGDYPALAGAAALPSSLGDGVGDGGVAHARTSDGAVDYLVSVVKFEYWDIGYELFLLSDVSAMEPAGEGGGLPADVQLALYALVAVLALLVVAVPTALVARRVKKAPATEAPVALDAAPEQGPEQEQGPDAVPEQEPVKAREEAPAAGLGSAMEVELESAAEPAPVAELEPAPAPEPAISPAPRPQAELAPYLGSLLAAGIPAGCMVRVACEGDAARNRVLHRMGALEEMLLECFEWEDASLVMVLSEDDQGEFGDALTSCLQGDGTVEAVVKLYD